MTREEAIKQVRVALERLKSNFSKTAWWTGTGEAFETLIPELKPDDETTRNEILAYIGSKTDIDLETHNRWCSYLEKQKYDRMKPVYDARESFESALEKAWNDYHNGYENVDKLEDDYVECAHAKGFREGYLFGIEKQKEQMPAESISQLTVQGKGVYKICPRCKERMVRDDSKVYTSMPPQYGYVCPKCGEMEFDTVMYDNPEIEEQKHVEWSKNDTAFLNEIIDFFENKTVRLQHDLDMYAHWLKSLPERFNLTPKQEWSEEDADILNCCISSIEEAKENRYAYKETDGDTSYDREIAFLKSLRPSWKPSKDEERLINTSVSFLKDFADKGYENAVECIDWLKSKLNGNSGK